MRIVGGTHKGLALAGPKSDAIRPTSDRTREALFNILTHGVDAFSLQDSRVLDLFAGTGALGLEALSRGARFALFVDENAASRALVRRNVEAMGATGISKIWRRDACRLGKREQLQPFDLVFADPPYGRGLGENALQSCLNFDWLREDSLCVLEEAATAEIREIGGLRQIDRRIYGDSQILLYRRI